MTTPTTEAGRALASDYRELAEAFHQVGSIRDHHDPNDIETCEDPYCRDALAGGDAIRAIEQEAVTDYRKALAARVRATPWNVSDAEDMDSEWAVGEYQSAILRNIEQDPPPADPIGCPRHDFTNDWECTCGPQAPSVPHGHIGRGSERRICVLAVNHRGLHRGDDGSEWSWYSVTDHRSPALDVRTRIEALLDRWEADGQGDLVSATAIRAALREQP